MYLIKVKQLLDRHTSMTKITAASKKKNYIMNATYKIT